jgi:hypothetical protein
MKAPAMPHAEIQPAASRFVSTPEPATFEQENSTAAVTFSGARCGPNAERS